MPTAKIVSPAAGTPSKPTRRIRMLPAAGTPSKSSRFTRVLGPASFIRDLLVVESKARTRPCVSARHKQVAHTISTALDKCCGDRSQSLSKERFNKNSFSVAIWIFLHVSDLGLKHDFCREDRPGSISSLHYNRWYTSLTGAYDRILCLPLNSVVGRNHMNDNVSNISTTLARVVKGRVSRSVNESNRTTW